MGQARSTKLVGNYGVQGRDCEGMDEAKGSEERQSKPWMGVALGLNYQLSFITPANQETVKGRPRCAKGGV